MSYDNNRMDLLVYINSFNLEEYKMIQEDKNMIIAELLKQKRRFQLEKSTLTHNSDNYHELCGRTWAYNDMIAFISSIKCK